MEPADLQDLLLRCLRRDTECLDEDRLRALSNNEWEELLALATAHSVRPLLYQRLKTGAPKDIVPAAVMESSRNCCLANAARNLRLCKQLRELVTALHSEDIPVVLLKGLYLAEAIYRSLAVREIGDLDLLVREEDLVRAAETLTGMGYLTQHTYSLEAQMHAMHHLPCFSKTNVECVPVELHWNVVLPRSPHFIVPDDLWTRALPVRVGNTELLGLCPEDVLLHLCEHASYHHEFSRGVHPLCDIAETVRTFGPSLNWDAVVTRAMQWRWDRGAYIALRLSREHLGAPVPSQVLRALRSPGFDDALLMMALDQTFTSLGEPLVSSTFANMWQQKGWGGRLKAGLQRFIIPRLVLCSQYGLSPGSPMVYPYYLVRCKGLLFRYSRALWRLLRGEEKLTSQLQRTNTLDKWLTGS